MAPTPTPRTSRLPPLSMLTATFSDLAAATFVHLDVDLGAQAADLAFGGYPGISIALRDRRPSAWRARTHACFPTAARAFSAIGRGELQERNYRAPPQLQNAQLDHAGSGLPVMITVAVALLIRSGLCSPSLAPRSEFGARAARRCCGKPLGIDAGSRRARHRPPSGSWSCGRRASRPHQRRQYDADRSYKSSRGRRAWSGAGTRHGRSCTESSARLPRSRRGSRRPE
jgi:hypothetical protein